MFATIILVALPHISCGTLIIYLNLKELKINHNLKVKGLILQNRDENLQDNVPIFLFQLEAIPRRIGSPANLPKLSN